MRVRAPRDGGDNTGREGVEGSQSVGGGEGCGGERKQEIRRTE